MGCAFYGAVSVFAELPKPDEIYDYEKYKNSDWLLDQSLDKEDNIKVEDQNDNHSSKFIL